uniref:Uncharacterized protein n=1 Tax=Anguilla anguilla TaxID=7936 RepID=A0A0E9VF18_ANGAN
MYNHLYTFAGKCNHL